MQRTGLTPLCAPSAELTQTMTPSEKSLMTPGENRRRRTRRSTLGLDLSRHSDQQYLAEIHLTALR